MDSTEKLQPMSYKKLQWLSIGVAVAIGWLLTLLVVYELEDYGVALFLFMPFLLGAAPVILLSRKYSFDKNHAWNTALAALAVYALGVLLFAIEGLICVIMGFPIAMLLVWIGSLVGYTFVKKVPANTAAVSVVVLIFLVPLASLIEKDTVPEITSVVSSIEIDAPPQEVWNTLIAFPPIAEPDELIFKTGIAYPISAEIKGQGVGAVRHCNFTTGSFVEPITVWNEPNLLRFDVEQQPAPMRELSFWDIDAPHLHDYFVSTQGQFKLTALPNGRTLLEGTTWYFLNIRPAIYWHLWSNMIVHAIHERVLEHIKATTESMTKR